MNGHRQEFGASWGKLLKGTSVTLMILVVCAAIIGMASGAGGWLVLLPLLLTIAVPFVVRGYVIEDKRLLIKRLGWETKLSLSDLQSAAAVPNAMRYSIRTCGNGGLLSFTGFFRSRELGSFRAFVNDLNHTVVLRFPKQIIVVSPDDPNAFVTAVNGVMDSGPR